MLKNLSLEEFLDQLASRSSTPGGGSAAGVMGAMGAALVAMVCNLTIGKEKYQAVEGEMRELLADAEALRADLTDLVAADVAAFDEVMAAYGLPKASEAEKTARTATIQRALGAASEVPLGCARLCARIIALSRRAAEGGNLNVVSDAGVAVMAAYAGLKSAALNVYINAGAIKDQDYVARTTAEIERLIAAAERDAPAVFALVKAKL